jgi:hypothetical protein
MEGVLNDVLEVVQGIEGVLDELLEVVEGIG